MPKPTNAELRILQILWRKGPSTVRDVQQELGEETGYTTALKLMQIMVEKKLLKRSEENRTHVYEAAVKEGATKKTLVRDFLDKAFAGSARDLVLQALSAHKPSPSELAEIRNLIEEMERKKQ
jgi:BlaI family transcriptional regulator, penicillinase repressor